MNESKALDFCKGGNERIFNLDECEEKAPMESLRPKRDTVAPIHRRK